MASLIKIKSRNVPTQDSITKERSKRPVLVASFRLLSSVLSFISQSIKVFSWWIIGTQAFHLRRRLKEFTRTKFICLQCLNPYLKFGKEVVEVRLTQWSLIENPENMYILESIKLQRRMIREEIKLENKMIISS